MDARAVRSLIALGLTVKRDAGVVWDPSCFFGGIAEELGASRDLEGKEFVVLATDTKARWPGCQKEQDFLEIPLASVSPKIELIMTRPPSARRTDYVEHALAIAARNDGGVFMLLPQSFHSFRLRELFEDRPIAGIFNVNDEWAWFYWDYRYDGELKTMDLEAA